MWNGEWIIEKIRRVSYSKKMAARKWSGSELWELGFKGERDRDIDEERERERDKVKGGCSYD